MTVLCLYTIMGIAMIAISDGTFSAKQMLEDLNGRRHPYGLVELFRRLHGVIDREGAHFNFALHRDPYLWRLRECVDLWLDTGRGRDGAEKPASRKPVPAITSLVSDVIERDTFGTVLLKNGYAISIRPNFSHLPSPPWSPSSKPSSGIDPANYASPEAYAGALLQQKFDAIPKQAAALRRTGNVGEVEPADLPLGKLSGYETRLVQFAAERAFVVMVMSDWRLKIAKCANASCGQYFRLGKWNQAYPSGARCRECREEAKASARQRLVDGRRKKAKKSLWLFAAMRFSRQVRPGVPWYRNAVLKRKMADALNIHITGDNLLKSIYPNGITGKWIAQPKNWKRIEAIAKRRKHATR